MPHPPQWLCKFDIDNYINPVVPPSPLHKLPKPIARFLGYRDGPCSHICTPLTWLWSFIGAFVGVSLIEGVYRSSAVIQSVHPPVILGSFGAAAILEYNTIESPLAQPRNAILSQPLSAAIGVSLTKLFAQLGASRFEELRWLPGALAVALSSTAMSITKTVHPPAGATALLAVTSSEVTRLGWWLVPLALLAAVLMVGSACLVNNVHRQFPMYWWTAKDLRQKGPPSDVERTAWGGGDIADERESEGSGPRGVRRIYITAEAVQVPDWLDLDEWEQSVLETLRLRLAEDDASLEMSRKELEE